MPTPLRILRTLADARPNARPKFSARELDREDCILDTSCALMARYGRANLTLTGLAIAMRLAPATIRRHFADLDTILFELLLRHLLAISRAINEIPFTHPQRQVAQRAAYIAFTRTGFSGPTEIHTLLVRERHTLPPDLEADIEDLRTNIGNRLVTEWPDAALSLLDNPFLQPPQIEATLAAIATPAAPPPDPKPILLSKQKRRFSRKSPKPAICLPPYIHPNAPQRNVSTLTDLRHPPRGRRERRPGGSPYGAFPNTGAARPSGAENTGAQECRASGQSARLYGRTRLG